MSERIVVAGASRGLGAAAAAHLSARGADVIAVSRTDAPHGRWVRADLSSPEGVAAVAAAVGAGPLDALIYASGIWEAGAFTDAYSFERSTPAEIRSVIDVNLVAPIALTQALSPALLAAPNPRAVFLGSLSGREGEVAAEVAYTASKFGLRGAAQALRVALKGAGLALTVLNLDTLATEEVEADIAAGRFAPQTPIPISDYLAVLDCVLALSAASEVREIDLAQRWGP